VALGAAVGAALGAFVGFLFTARGRQVRARLEPHVDTLARRSGLVAAAGPLRRAVLGQWGPFADLLLNGIQDDGTPPERPGSPVH
jgi:hypothetical protein